MFDPEKCRITHYPAPVLSQRAVAVEEIDAKIRVLAEKMIDIMIETKGVGLAGPQAGVNLRIFVASVDGSREKARVYINPEITPSGSSEAMEEGCLSLPGVCGKIVRYTKCRIKATGLDGEEFSEDAEGLLARIFQHEFDHLEGTVIADKLSSVARIAARKRLKALRERYDSEVGRK